MSTALVSRNVQFTIPQAQRPSVFFYRPPIPQSLGHLHLRTSSDLIQQLNPSLPVDQLSVLVVRDPDVWRPRFELHR